MRLRYLVLYRQSHCFNHTVQWKEFLVAWCLAQDRIGVTRHLVWCFESCKRVKEKRLNNSTHLARRELSLFAFLIKAKFCDLSRKLMNVQPPPTNVSTPPKPALLQVILGCRHHSALDNHLERKAQGCILPSCSDRWDNAAPTPLFDASTSTTNWRCGSGRVRMGAVVNQCLRVWNAFSVFGDQWNGTWVEVRAWSGASIALKPLTNCL